MKFIASLILISLFAFTSTAIASDVVTDPDIMQQIFDAVAQGQWWAAAAATVIAVLALVRRYLPESWKTGTKGDMVGVSLAFATAFAGAVANWAVTPDATMSIGVMATATKVGIAAIGGFTIIHKMLGWLASWNRLPAWVSPVLGLIAKLIGSTAVKKAEAAGAAAVAAAPAPGMTPGKLREVD